MSTSPLTATFTLTNGETLKMDNVEVKLLNDNPKQPSKVVVTNRAFSVTFTVPAEEATALFERLTTAPEPPETPAMAEEDAEEV